MKKLLEVIKNYPIESINVFPYKRDNKGVEKFAIHKVSPLSFA